MMTSVGLPIVIIVLLAIIAYLLFILIKKLQSPGIKPPIDPRPPKTFVRSINFDDSTNRWQLTCKNRLPENVNNKDLIGRLPEVDQCITDDNKLAPPLVVRANDVIAFDFNSAGPEEFVWVELQFPEPDLFVDIGPNRFDDYVVRVERGKALFLRVRDRKPCNDSEFESRFVYAIHVVRENSGGIQSPTGFVQGGSPPEIRIKHA